MSVLSQWTDEDVRKLRDVLEPLVNSSREAGKEGCVLAKDVQGKFSGFAGIDLLCRAAAPHSPPLDLLPMPVHPVNSKPRVARVTLAELELKNAQGTGREAKTRDTRTQPLTKHAGPNGNPPTQAG